MSIYTVSFFGHRQLEDSVHIEKQLETLIRKLLLEREYVVFLVGRDGEFDLLVSSVIRRCKQAVRADNSAHVWVLPYPTAEFRDNEASFYAYYDEIELCEASCGTYFKGAHQKRNHNMVDRSHLVVCCVRREYGGAWQTMRYAQKWGVPCLNLAESVEVCP